MQMRNLKKAVLRDGIFLPTSSFTGTTPAEAYIEIAMPTGRTTRPISPLL
jgi:xanthine/uracil/vitamin C permease (AzgA family)